MLARRPRAWVPEMAEERETPGPGLSASQVRQVTRSVQGARLGREPVLLEVWAGLLTVVVLGAVLGAVLAHHVADAVKAGLAPILRADPELASKFGQDDGGLPDLSGYPAPIRAVFESAFGDATGHIFLVAIPFAVGALVAVLLIKEVPLRTSVLRDDELAPEVAAEIGLDQPGGVRA